MGSFFYNLGKMVGPSLRKGKWVFQSFAGSEADALRAEYEVGRDLAQTLTREMSMDAHPGARQLLQELGSGLAARVRDRRRKFSYRLVQAAEINAYALPGGFIFVTRPLLELCGWDRDEVAFILGHEMAHVLRGHAMERIMNGWALAAAGRAVPLAGWAGTLLLRQVHELLHQAYSRDQELDADLLGVQLVQSAGFEASAAVRLLRRLQGNSPDDPALSSYFASHPPFAVRIENVTRRLNG
jgi:predicted Zn-dependent protease